MKRILYGLLLALFAVSFVSASGNHSVEQWEYAESIIEANTSCDELTEEQLELLGDYYMEQLHPGEMHTRMDQMMGGEGSESLRQAHMFMARRWYCGDAAGMGMMGMMMGGTRNISSNMGAGMMQGFEQFGSFGSMMGSLGGLGMGLTQILVWILLITGIVAIVKYIATKK